MAGVHGKNAELRISTGETAKAAVTLVPHPDSGLAAKGVFAAPDRNWKYAQRGEADAPKVTYESPSGVFKEIDSNSRLIHYAAGAVLIPADDLPALVPGSVKADYTTLEMETVANLTTEDRGAEINLENEEVDTTTIGERFKTSVEGIPSWSGSLDGLYLNPERYKLAVANASGIIPRNLLRVHPRPDKKTYWQGTVTFPNYNLSLAHDSAIERSVDFTGQGPLDLMEDDKPFFPGL